MINGQRITTSSIRPVLAHSRSSGVPGDAVTHGGKHKRFNAATSAADDPILARLYLRGPNSSTKNAANARTIRAIPTNIIFLTGPKSPRKNAATPTTAIKLAARPAILEIPLVSPINLTISDDRKDRHSTAHCFRTFFLFDSSNRCCTRLHAGPCKKIDSVYLPAGLAAGAADRAL